MKIKLSIFLSILILSCSRNTEKEVKNEKPSLAINTDFKNITDSLDEAENLIHFEYQNLTRWGGIEVWSLENEIVKIIATQKPELGFTKTTHFYEDGSNYKSVLIKHEANWEEFHTKYGEIDPVGDERMTYTIDTMETVVHYSVLDSFDLKMIQEASEILIFVNSKNKFIP